MLLEFVKTALDDAHALTETLEPARRPIERLGIDVDPNQRDLRRCLEQGLGVAAKPERAINEDPRLGRQVAESFRNQRWLVRIVGSAGLS